MSAHEHGEQEQDERDQDLLGQMMAYEAGEMEDDEQVLEFFQTLVDTGLAWSLQGHYGRAAQALIRAGMIRPALGEE